MTERLAPQALAANQYEEARKTSAAGKTLVVSRALLAIAAALLAINDTLRERLPRP